ASAADRLGVRPMFELRAGRVRGLRPARADGDLGRLVRLCLDDRSNGAAALHAVVMHAGATDRANRLADRLAASIPAAVAPALTVSQFGPALVAHTGPGVLGLAWWWGEPSF